MAIVLAIEPDRHQAAHLAAIVRHQVDAELIIADTTEGALDAIGNRVPDLVLVPALLSPQDDAALAAALRVIAAAAHVRTLTIPVLASGITRAPSGGMLAKWRKHRAASPEPDGCDPTKFGEQISACLQDAAAERAQLAEHGLLHEEPSVPAPSMPRDADRRDDTQAPAQLSGHGAVLGLGIEEPWSSAPETVRWVTADPIEEPTIAQSDDPMIDLSEALEGLCDKPDGETLNGEAVGVHTITADADLSVFDDFDLMPGIVEPRGITEDVEAALDQIAAAASVGTEPVRARQRRVEPAPRERVSAPPLMVEPPAAPRATIIPWMPMYLTAGRIWPAMEGVPAEMPASRLEQPDWIELVASLRQDLERRRTDLSSPAGPIAPRPPDGADTDAHRLAKTSGTPVNKARPVQDEWGFFDPERCGFSTLLAKLEEITEEVRS
jgi:hypothetical protein